jgi:hypothetical protein
MASAPCIAGNARQLNNGGKTMKAKMTQIIVYLLTVIAGFSLVIGGAVTLIHFPKYPFGLAGTIIGASISISSLAIGIWTLAQLSQPEGQGTGKVNKNNVRSQKVSTTFALPSLVYHMTLVGDSGWRLRRQAEVQLF